LGVYLHELGHMFGAAPRGRTNTEENLGSHCLNDYCVMQQKLTVPAFSEHDNKIASRIENDLLDSWFCEQCQDDITKKSRR
jgi:predicted Zn-dependent protease